MTTDPDGDNESRQPGSVVVPGGRNYRLVEAMDAASVTIRQLAEAAQVDTKTVQRWIAGRTPQRSRAYLAAQAMRVPPLELWPGLRRPLAEPEPFDQPAIRFNPQDMSVWCESRHRPEGVLVLLIIADIRNRVEIPLGRHRPGIDGMRRLADLASLAADQAAASS